MRRPQFSLKTLLWLMAVVAAFFAGAVLERECEFRQQLALHKAAGIRAFYIGRPKLLDWKR